MSNRDVQATWTYHNGTKHSLDSVRRSAHRLEWDIMPRPFKVYPDIEPIPLPQELIATTTPALAVLSSTGGQPMPALALDRTALARLLYFSAGVLRRRTHPGGEHYFRAAACTGALYHIDLYVICGALADLAAGVYHFGPHDFALRQLRAGDYRAAVIEATGGEPAIAAAPVIIASTSTFWRNAWKYQARAYRHCFWDNGTLLANLLGIAAAAATPAHLVLGFVDSAVNQLLDLDMTREVTLSLVAVGSSEDSPPPAPPAPQLSLATLPYSAHEVDYPAIRAMHAASSLASPAEAAAWRQPFSRPLAADLPPDAIPLAPLAAESWPRESIEQVIRRRGSSRRFAHSPISFETFSTILRGAARSATADYAAAGVSLATPYVIAHAVDGLPAGTYAFDRRHEALIPLRRGDFRRESGNLALGQDLGADAAANVYWLADLNPVLEQFGNRGYRAAQLDAAIAGGAIYLAAYGLHTGATGLTFFDDDVTDFFSPHAAGKSVMFYMAIGDPMSGRTR